jgi:hypothetical protein
VNRAFRNDDVNNFRVESHEEGEREAQRTKSKDGAPMDRLRPFQKTFVNHAFGIFSDASPKCPRNERGDVSIVPQSINYFGSRVIIAKLWRLLSHRLTHVAFFGKNFHAPKLQRNE